MVIVPAVTETDTSSMPVERLTAVSILDAQEAQSIPLTRYLVLMISFIAVNLDSFEICTYNLMSL
ncbi:hypothetical protein GGQ67_000920 [Rhizobium metallidurans]|uniref:Uncharacterized protein n=1 Tax=Rhizobium metallidurans TaxID=1265931 RepID=A0A7W6G9W2_9HYPH|nr:hypothetical protein [Rhizobium metallidurans]